VPIADQAVGGHENSVTGFSRTRTDIDAREARFGGEGF